MARKKVKLAFIVNDAARKASYKKRVKGLLKKVNELTTLCGIEACAIIYSQYDPKLVVWPSPFGVHRVLSKFRTMPELEQTKKMVNQETYLNQRIAKAKEQLKKQMKDNRENEMNLLMIQSLSAMEILHNNMTLDDLNDLSWLIDQNLKNVDRRLETLNKNADISTSQPQMAAPIAMNEEVTLVDQVHGLDMNADTMQKQGFVNLINGNGDGTMPSGDANLQNGF
ncbi:agamous-like MADS-box protein AGL80 [Gastrolobium bilobum]|uniref:agamous-like MADS-box protein AGL80 n=1 Tax=Gastrolobium bilobum TaxID=150636 RepID=UPI002AB12C84|nr:agamous-like MADS-box protein AGL80 [Gastrolobium bilobum]